MGTSLDKLAAVLPREMRQLLQRIQIDTVEALAGRLADDDSARSLRLYLGISPEQLLALTAAVRASTSPVAERRKFAGGALLP